MTGPRITGVLCCGNTVLDILVRPVKELAWGRTVRVEHIEEHLGGNGASTAYALARLGTPVRLLTVLGGDKFGEQAAARLAGAGVDLSYATRSKLPAPTTVVLVNPTGERLFLHRLGASAEAFGEALEFPADLVRGFSHLHLGNVFGLPQLRPHAPQSLRRARQEGLTTSVDTGWDTTGKWIEDIGPCLPFTDLLFVNALEAEMLAGMSDTEAAAGKLRALGAAVVIVKLGEAGCLIASENGCERAPGFSVSVVDTTGAGDCFAGAFLGALHRGADLIYAARFANAAAALAIQHLGATVGLRSYAETEAWMATN